MTDLNVIQKNSREALQAASAVARETESAEIRKLAEATTEAARASMELAKWLQIER
jgi:uncharacterized membrane protein (DUF106 family)